MNQSKNRRFLKFAIVGVGGFFVDILVTYALSQFVMVEVARGAAFWVAASSNWWLNRQFTFSSSQQERPLKQWIQFLSASSLGFLPNWGCYWILMNSDIGLATSSILSIDISTWWPYLAMVPSILLGMGVNFVLSDRWVFRLAATR
ncbi:GtrA family protein [Photobacterium rosenbergii]|uniref:GtrA family protein n=1 Tax=Photobacterium rosenbergii TaxID=294936 RepID=UPI001C99E702|nr:GtrA family protein [Photobacterium rosenbergii]MBY5946334.1 GtrA family protein [Photobacterium rosenbergii]